MSLRFVPFKSSFQEQHSSLSTTAAPKSCRCFCSPLRAAQHHPAQPAVPGTVCCRKWGPGQSPECSLPVQPWVRGEQRGEQRHAPSFPTAASRSLCVVVTEGEASIDTMTPHPGGHPWHRCPPPLQDPASGSFPSPATAPPAAAPAGPSQFPQGFIKAASKRRAGRAGDGKRGPWGVPASPASEAVSVSHAGITPAPCAAAAHSSLFTCSDAHEPGPVGADAPSLLLGSLGGRGPAGQRCLMQEGPSSPGIALNLGKEEGGCLGG